VLISGIVVIRVPQDFDETTLIRLAAEPIFNAHTGHRPAAAPATPALKRERRARPNAAAARR
jgi:hypothetical protein